jgi:hypothetical protein
MTTAKHFAPSEVVALFDAAAILTYPIGGGVQVEKAGITGFGLTLGDATAIGGSSSPR